MVVLLRMNETQHKVILSVAFYTIMLVVVTPNVVLPNVVAYNDCFYPEDSETFETKERKTTFSCN